MVSCSEVAWKDKRASGRIMAAWIAVLHPPHKVPEGKLVVVQTCGAKNDADIAQGALESAGIAAAIEAVPVGNKNSPLLFGEPVFRVVVREEDAEAAHGVLDTSRE